MSGVRSLAVFCGSRHGTDPRYAATARSLGAGMAERGVTLVYGGGGVGIMGTLAGAVLEAGGEVVGIIPEFLVASEAGDLRLTRREVVGDMHTRKARMFELADAFAVLPGGMGTLDETLEITTWRQLGLHDKPILVLDVGGYWSALTDLVGRVVEAGFADPATLDLFRVVGDADALLDAVLAAPPAPPVSAERL